jgi:hypothetical protein
MLLIEFIEVRRQAGVTVREAVIEAGAVRFRPILLTAVTAMIGALFIIVDPNLQGPGNLALRWPDLVDAADNLRDPGALHLALRR